MEIIEIIRSYPEYAKAEKAGQNPEEIIAKAMESDRFKKFKSPQTRISILLAALNSAGVDISVEGDSFDEMLILLGGGDSYGRKNPVNVVCMRGKPNLEDTERFVTIGTWDVSDLPVMPCKARVRGTYLAKFNSVQLPKSGNGITDVTPVTLDTVQKALQKVALDPTSSTDHGRMEKMERYKHYAFIGRLKYINGSPIFKTIETTDEKTGEIHKQVIRIGENQLVALDEHNPPRNHVTCSLSVDCDDSGYSVAFQIPRQRHGRPGIHIEDFEALCYDAVEQTAEIEDTEKRVKQQCTMVREGIFGRRVIGVGSASSITDKIDAKGNQMLYINLTCGYLQEVSREVEGLKGRETLVDQKDVEPECIATIKKELKEKREGKKKPEQAPEPEPEPSEVNGQEERIVNELVEYGLTMNLDRSISATRNAGKLSISLNRWLMRL
jgi:hypothetical protein